MAKKTDFTNINTGRMYDQLAEATAEPAQDQQEIEKALPGRKKRKTYTEEETEALLQTMKTAGHKGLKLPRINVAFAPDVYNYITIMAQVRGQSATQFINHVLRLNMEQHQDIYQKAIEFRNSL